MLRQFRAPARQVTHSFTFCLRKQAARTGYRRISKMEVTFQKELPLLRLLHLETLGGNISGLSVW